MKGRPALFAVQLCDEQAAFIGTHNPRNLTNQSDLCHYVFKSMMTRNSNLFLRLTRCNNYSHSVIMPCLAHGQGFYSS